MKKLITFISSAVLALGIGAVSASAQTPSINYNGEPQAIENIRNVDGRVQLPFRAVFEMMGATVDYEDATRKVTAKRDNTTVEFFANGTELTVTDENGTSTIPAEIGFDYERNRVMVPVRFVSNAMGSRVGWDDSTKTVFILDTYKLTEELQAHCPTVVKLFEIFKNVDTNLAESGNINMNFAFTSPETGKTTALDLNASMSSAMYETTGKGNLTFDFTHQNLNELTGYNLGQLKGAEFNVLMTDSAIYLNTNLGSKIPELLPEETELHAVQNYLKADTWFRIDYSFVAEKLGKPLADALFNGTSIDAEAFFDTLTISFESDADVTQDEMILVVTYFDVLEEMFSKLTITETAPGTFTVSMAMTEEDILSFFLPEEYAEFDPALYETIVAEVKNMIKLAANVNVTVKDGSSINEDVSIVFDINYNGMKILSLSMTGNATASKITEAPSIQIPENSISIESILTLLQ